MPSLQYQGHTVHYWDSGKGNPVVLLHAGASSSKQWQKIGGYLQDDFRLLAPDLFGFGETDRWSGPGELSHDRQAGLVQTLIDTVCDGPVHVVGHSYGGSTAMRLVVLNPPGVKSLVLIEPNIVPLLEDAGAHEMFEEYRQVADTFMEDAAADRVVAAWKMFVDLRNGAGTWDAMPEKRRVRMMEQTRQTVDAFKSNLSNPTSLADCREVDVPSLVICGAKTTRPERRITEILAAVVPHCRYEIIPEAEHMSPVTHPEAVSALISDHLARCDSANDGSAKKEMNSG